MTWQFLLAAREIVAQAGTSDTSLGYDSRTGLIVRTDFPDSSSFLWLDSRGNWCRKSDLPLVCHAILDLYLPVLGNRNNTRGITAHLGQSIDARIATVSGDSFYVTGESNRKHLHCLRALSDAVIVGSGTIIADNPQLTTRAVPGANPVRVIIDPSARLTGPLQIFNDGLARTLLVHQSSANLGEREMCFGPQVTDPSGRSSCQVERVVVPNSDEKLAVNSIVESLGGLGLYRLFVEGGGITVSRFFEERLLNRLHVAVAPILVGAGTEALQIKGVAKMIQAHRPPHAIYRMGEDVLWDFDISSMKNKSLNNVMADENTSTDYKQEQLTRPSLERIR